MVDNEFKLININEKAHFVAGYYARKYGMSIERFIMSVIFEWGYMHSIAESKYPEIPNFKIYKKDKELLDKAYKVYEDVPIEIYRKTKLDKNHIPKKRNKAVLRMIYDIMNEIARGFEE